MKKSWVHLGFRLAYHGKPFFGFQIQSNAPTVQEAVEKALRTLFRKSIRVQFTSRTDTGVHAYDQWVLIENGMHLWNELSSRERARFLISFNALLKGEIVVWQILSVRDDFQPKKTIEWKEYIYSVLNSPALDPLQRETAWWVARPLDVAAMRRAQKELLGTHDFAAFAKAVRSDPEKSTVRTLTAVSVTERRHPFMLSARHIIFRFRGTGFLHHMVRRLVGDLVSVGLGESESLMPILRSKDPKKGRFNAPPEGLFLARTSVKKCYARVIQTSRINDL